jgi:hypothetical protein
MFRHLAVPSSWSSNFLAKINYYIKIVTSKSELKLTKLIKTAK